MDGRRQAGKTAADHEHVNTVLVFHCLQAPWTGERGTDCVTLFAAAQVNLSMDR
jgi:hypothetical protein